MPNVYVIGGANGAGKTTTALTVLPNFLNVVEYINADAIAAELSPINPEAMAIPAGRIMLKRLTSLVAQEIDFAFETTLASRSFAPFLRNCKTSGYIINLIYFWLQSPELAIARVASRVHSGGYSIPEDTIRRRYTRGLRNLASLYLPICDRWIIYDNSGTASRLVAEYGSEQSPIIYNRDTWSQIMEN